MHSFPKFLAAGLALAALALPRPASAQAGAQGLPDLSGIAGAIAGAAAPPAPAKGKTFHTALAVPTIHAGAEARDVGRQYREAVEKATGKPNPAMQKIEAAMPALLTGMEQSMEAHGFAKRDLGVAFGAFFVQNWEIANKHDLSDAAEATVVRSVAAHAETQYKARFAAMTPAAKEKTYEQLLSSTALTLVFVQAFDKIGKTQEATSLRHTSDLVFQKVVGVPATQVAISDTGGVTDLRAADTSAPTPPGAPTDVPLDAPPATP